MSQQKTTTLLPRAPLCSKKVFLSYHFATKAQIGCKNTRQLLFLLNILSHINPNGNLAEKDIIKRVISINAIVKFTAQNQPKRSGSIYEEARGFIADIMRQNYVSFVSNIKWKGKYLPNYFCIFDKLDSFKRNQSEYYEYEINEGIRPHLIKSEEQIVFIIPSMLKSRYAVRFYILAMAEYSTSVNAGQVLPLTIQLNELKRLLGIADKYASFSNFKKRVLKPILSQINQHHKALCLSIKDINFVKDGHRINHLIFNIKGHSPTLGNHKVPKALPYPSKVNAINWKSIPIGDIGKKDSPRIFPEC